MLRDSTEKGKHLGLGIKPVIPSLTLGRTAESVSRRRQNAAEDLSCGNLAEAVRRPRQRVRRCNQSWRRSQSPID